MAHRWAVAAVSFVALVVCCHALGPGTRLEPVAVADVAADAGSVTPTPPSNASDCAAVWRWMVDADAAWHADQQPNAVTLWLRVVAFFEAHQSYLSAPDEPFKAQYAPPAGLCVHLFTAALNNIGVVNYVRGHVVEALQTLDLAVQLRLDMVAVKNYAWVNHAAFKAFASSTLATTVTQIQTLLWLNRTKLIVSRADVANLVYGAAGMLDGDGMVGQPFQLPPRRLAVWDLTVTIMPEPGGGFSVYNVSSPNTTLNFYRDQSLHLSLFEQGPGNARLCRSPYMLPPCGAPPRAANTFAYLDALKRDLVGLAAVNVSAFHGAPVQESIWCDGSGKPVLLDLLHRGPAFFTANIANLNFVTDSRTDFADCPSTTMSSMAMLNNAQAVLETLVRNRVPGDVMETGAWRGGVSIFMRAVLNSLGQHHRRVFVADSFRGVPPPRVTNKDDPTYRWKPWLYAASLPMVASNFDRRGLLDDSVVFVEGLFNESLRTAPVHRLALLRIDGDTYESCMDVLAAVYHRLSSDGVVIIDDFHLAGCRQAAQEFRTAHHITAPIFPVPEDHVLACRQHGPLPHQPTAVPVHDLDVTGDAWPGLGRLPEAVRGMCRRRAWLWGGCDPWQEASRGPHGGGTPRPPAACDHGGADTVPFHAYPYKPLQAAMWVRHADSEVWP